MDLHVVFIIIGSVMGAFSLILLLVGFLATGATRERVYRGFKSRIGGRVSCAFVSSNNYNAYVLFHYWMVYHYWWVKLKYYNSP